MSETVELKVGKKGEIYTTEEVRRKAGIVPGGRVVASVESLGLVMKPKPTALDLLRKPRAKMEPLTPHEVARFRKELAQRLGRR